MTATHAAWADKGTYFSQTRSIRCGSLVLDLSKPVVMGILNVTADSFYDGGKYLTPSQVTDRAGEMFDAGATILDIGALSTRPGTHGGNAEEETERLIPAIELIRKHFPEALISADTYRASVAEMAVGASAAIINDISGGTMDDEMHGFMLTSEAAYVLMHIQGTPATMQQKPVYANVVAEVKAFFEKQLQPFVDAGKQNIILDPGFGFGKDVPHNYQLLAGFADFTEFGFPLLAGVSRKSMINKVLQIKPSQALNGTTVLNTIALMNGANILRVHDVKEAVEAVKLFGALQEYNL
ncbi:MAG: dihydropteroate synthase [Bacteroidetes bacterium HGW-Bacteroidetes-11]|jgi:dihydropteroate synthase|nr:MAG: dihydropteroate synthase [Bacteroidetes bacterium HGW-Bacteroidetes-11]